MKNKHGFSSYSSIYCWEEAYLESLWHHILALRSGYLLSVTAKLRAGLVFFSC